MSVSRPHDLFFLHPVLVVPASFCCHRSSTTSDLSKNKSDSRRFRVLIFNRAQTHVVARVQEHHLVLGNLPLKLQRHFRAGLHRRCTHPLCPSVQQVTACDTTGPAQGDIALSFLCSQSNATALNTNSYLFNLKKYTNATINYDFWKL